MGKSAQNYTITATAQPIIRFQRLESKVIHNTCTLHIKR